MKLQLAKGTKDSSPEEMIGLQKVMDNLRIIFEKYGFVPLDTPVIERFDILSAKYAGGAEILKETFKLKDQGDRELGLRYDLTIPFARYVGMNPMLKLPFKRYHIGKVWRDGPVGLGRFREFWQCDVDIMGSSFMGADAEILALASNVFKELNLEVVIFVNNRKLLNGLLDAVGVSKNKEDIMLVIDKIEKISKKELLFELSSLGVSNSQSEKLFDYFNFKGDNLAKLAFFKTFVSSTEGIEGLSELESLFGFLDEYGVKNYELNVSLSRGLAIYTGTVFETMLVNSEVKGSVAGGGRYDKVISQFLGSKSEYPCVGISFGLSRINSALSFSGLGSLTELFVVPINLDKEHLFVVQSLRDKGLNVETDIIDRTLNKNLAYVNSKKIPFVLFVGENELKSKKFKLKNMVSGDEFVISLNDVLKFVKNK